jgi:natural product precursor
MKKLKRLSLQTFGKTEMEKQEQTLITGGYCTFVWIGNDGCPCKYAGAQEGPNDDYYGGASHEDSHDSNN